MSYINNLHLFRHRELYHIIERIIAKAIPLWNATLNPLQDYFTPPPRIELEGTGYVERDTPEPKYPDDDNYDAYEAQSEAWRESREIEQPEPKDFKPPEDRLREKYAGQVNRFKDRPGPLDLREIYATLQIIVKLANIHLTPEKPKYEGGSWHVEGQMNENM